MDSSAEVIAICLSPEEELEPSPDELDRLYQKLEAGGTLELSWKCPNRRLPTPVNELDAESFGPTNENENKNVEFDFMDDVAVPTMRVRQLQNAKGPKKKTTNFASVLDAMKKNKRSTLSKE